jgi:hypothetical protein
VREHMVYNVVHPYQCQGVYPTEQRPKFTRSCRPYTQKLCITIMRTYRDNLVLTIVGTSHASPQLWTPSATGNWTPTTLRSMELRYSSNRHVRPHTGRTRRRPARTPTRRRSVVTFRHRALPRRCWWSRCYIAAVV